MELLLLGVVGGLWWLFKGDGGSCSSCGGSGRYWNGSGTTACHCPRGDNARATDNSYYRGY